MNEALGWVAMVSLVAAAHAEGQPRRSVAVDGLPIRVQSGGNELVAVRDAPVAYTRLEQLVEDIARPAEPRAAPIQLERASPRSLVDYVLCVTRDGTLVIGERMQTFDAGERRYVFVRGDIARSYRPLDTPEGWLWLMEVPLSRELTVTLELRARPPWPIESVMVTADHLP
jgi:hypothetical protein